MSKKTDTKENKKSIYIIEGVIGVVAVVFIIVALVISGKKNAGPNTTSQNGASSSTSDISLGDMGNGEMIEIDNSILFENIPNVPDAAAINKFSEDDCSKLLKLENADGSYVYVANFEDEKALKKEIVCSDDDLQAFLYRNLLVNNIVPLTEEREVAKLYDSVSINYAGFLGDEQFEGGTADNQTANLGSGSYIPGFEEGIVGMKVGETKDVKVTFPEDYRAENLAGKNVTFKITLNAIIGAPAELTDELVAQSFTDFANKDELLDYAKTQILGDKVYDFLNEKYYVSKINDDIAINYYNSTMGYYDMMSYQYQMSIEDMLIASDSSLDDFRNDVMASAAESALSVTMYYAIAEHLGLSITDDEIQEMCTSYGYASTEEFFSTYGEQTVRDALITDKVTLHIVDLVKED